MSHAATLPNEDRRRRADVAIGMSFLVAALTMAFLTVFVSFLVIRAQQPKWPPEGIVLPSLPLAALGGVVLLASSVALAGAVRRARAGAPGFARHWALGLLLALGFAALQTWIWTAVWRSGGRPDTGVYHGLFFLLTWFHAAHVACGLVGLLWVQAGAATGRIGPGRIATAAALATFWHFVDVVWLVLFLGFFVL
jgi:heme/copper-type cytochrome/quinol oxidase subunit 3